MEERAQYSLPPPTCERHPWLMFSHGKNKQRQTFFNIPEHHYYTKIIPELHNKRVACSSYGWLILEDLDSDDCFLLNLLSMEKIQLPPMDLDYEVCILSLPPSDPNCYVLFVTNDFLLSWQPGDNEFVRKDFQIEVEFIDWASIIVHQGQIYAIVNPKAYILVADFTRSIIRFTKLINESAPIIGSHGIIFFKSYLIESSGELLVVHKVFSTMFQLRHVVLNFEIYRLDRSKDIWTKVRNIGKQTIFLSADEGKCRLVQNAGIKENSIYFTRYRNLYVFDLDDQSVTVSLPCPNVSKSRSNLYWIW